MSNLPRLLRFPSVVRCFRNFPRYSSSASGNGDQPEFIPVPEYAERHGENIEVRKARLLYQSRKRGMLENGLLLSTFASKYLRDMTEHQVELYDKLINKPSNDWEIYYWATGNKPTPEEYQSEIMDMLKEHARNEDRDCRITQPPLFT
ncbi:succinate dehydrogenase assembly factor 2, mitochondrial-like [Saccostrea cucullata]|uniref:succinate dehydrogenase assembly factor 2, mitochondrial-like n=1 Tax=Saccostrea cuccullata TaxID=36930 RepID=UPI002ED0ED16